MTVMYRRPSMYRRIKVQEGPCPLYSTPGPFWLRHSLRVGPYAGGVRGVAPQKIHKRGKKSGFLLFFFNKMVQNFEKIYQKSPLFFGNKVFKKSKKDPFLGGVRSPFMKNLRKRLFFPKKVHFLEVSHPPPPKKSCVRAWLRDWI